MSAPADSSRMRLQATHQNAADAHKTRQVLGERSGREFAENLERPCALDVSVGALASRVHKLVLDGVPLPRLQVLQRWQGSFLRIRSFPVACEIPRGSECPLLWNRRPSRRPPGKCGRSPAGSSKLALGPQLAKPILLQPLGQVPFFEAPQLRLPLVLLADHHRFRSLGHGVHEDV